MKVKKDVRSKRLRGLVKLCVKKDLADKSSIRTTIWRTMEKLGVTRLPKPVFGRIPNFVGAEVAAKRLSLEPEFINARAIKVNPDSPQRAVRYLTLLNEKMLVMPSPKLKEGFILLDPHKISSNLYFKASTIRGAFKYGIKCSLKELPPIDLIVTGCVAVSIEGVRVGKGGGFSELEYAILRELNLINEKTPILTTVHEVQIVDWAPKEIYDLVVDAIVTPQRVIRVENKIKRPKGIFWNLINEEMIRSMPILSELKSLKISNRNF